MVRTCRPPARPVELLRGAPPTIMTSAPPTSAPAASINPVGPPPASPPRVRSSTSSLSARARRSVSWARFGRLRPTPPLGYDFTTAADGHQIREACQLGQRQPAGEPHRRVLGTGRTSEPATRSSEGPEDDRASPAARPRRYERAAPRGGHPIRRCRWGRGRWARWSTRVRRASVQFHVSTDARTCDREACKTVPVLQLSCPSVVVADETAALAALTGPEPGPAAWSG
jgi:hypothetical protein